MCKLLMSISDADMVRRNSVIHLEFLIITGLLSSDN